MKRKVEINEEEKDEKEFKKIKKFQQIQDSKLFSLIQNYHRDLFDKNSSKIEIIKRLTFIIQCKIFSPKKLTFKSKS